MKMHIFISIYTTLLFSTYLHAFLPPRCIQCSLSDCYQKMISAGVFDLASFNVQACIDACTSLEFIYSIPFHSNCFCIPSSVDITPLITSNVNCPIPCPATATDLLNSAFCGAAPNLGNPIKIMSVYEAQIAPKFLSFLAYPLNGSIYASNQVLIYLFTFLVSFFY